MTASIRLSDYAAGSDIFTWLIDFFRRHTNKEDPDLCFYDKEFWRKRGEEFGDDAEFTLIVEGAELSVLTDEPTLQELSERLKSDGMWWEMSNCVTFHFYRDIGDF